MSEMHGTMRGYEPEYRYDTFEDSAGPSMSKWKAVPYETRNTGVLGHPYPRFAGGILQTAGLLGQAQANAIGWSFAAQCEAEGKHIEIRVVEHEVKYDIKHEPVEQIA